jgi:hypothetical protein
MQDIFSAAQSSSKETVTEAEIMFCPAAMVGARDCLAWNFQTLRWPEAQRKPRFAQRKTLGKAHAILAEI